MSGDGCNKDIRVHQNTTSTADVEGEPETETETLLTDFEASRGGKRPRDSTGNAVVPPIVKRRQGATSIEEGGKGVGGDRSEKRCEHAAGLTINLAAIARCKPRQTCAIERRPSDLHLEQADGRLDRVEIPPPAGQTGFNDEERRVEGSEVSNNTPALPSNEWERMQERKERFGSAHSTKLCNISSRYKCRATYHVAHSYNVNDQTGELLRCTRTFRSEDSSSLRNGGPSAVDQPETANRCTKDNKAELRTRRVRFKIPVEIIVEPTAPTFATSVVLNNEIATKMARRAERFGMTGTRSLLVSLISIYRKPYESTATGVK